MTGRSVPEWRSENPDAKIPDHVALRVFEEHGGRCHITGRLIVPGDKWHMDHIKPLADNGEHRESNLAPALVDAHKEKTAAEAAERAGVRKRAKSHIGLKGQPTALAGPTYAESKQRKEVRSKERQRDGKLPVPAPRSIFGGSPQ